MNERLVKNIMTRLKKLEEAVFSKNKEAKPEKQVKDFSGAKGGILKLLSKDFFKTKKSASEAKKALEDDEYHYSIQVVQTALNRLSKKDGPTVSFMHNGKKTYVKRK